MSVNTKMTAIADKIRSLLGLTGTMGLDAMNTNLGSAVVECDAQAALIVQIKEGLAETEASMGRTNLEIDTQSGLIQEIKTALEGKAAGGGVQLPTLTNPGTAGDMASGKQLIDASGKVVTGTVEVIDREAEFGDFVEATESGSSVYTEHFVTGFNMIGDAIIRENTRINVYVPKSQYGDAKPEDVAQGKTFTSAAGLLVEGTATGGGGGMVIKSGTTTSRTINTGLSDVEQFFMYKESQTATGLIHLHYTKSATSRMYASAWSTQNYGTKTITNGTGGVTVSGGTITISATQATQGALSSNVTYKWVAIGT